ncbi:unnamed protein product [Durusdinium trenchii]
MSEPGLPEGHGAVAPRGVAVFVEGETTTYGAPERVADEAEEVDDPEEGETVAEREEREERYRQRLIELMRKMDLTSQQIQRVTPCHNLLSCFGRILRTAQVRDWYHLSKPSAKIHQFISHSWHGSPWKKIAMLLVLKNGLGAAIVGSLLALIMVLLSSLNLLPGYPRQPLIEPDRTYIFAPWGLGVGMLSGSIVLFFSEARQSVFFDKICIHQKDVRLKFEGVINICAFLKNSESLLVLWDATYVERLWCVFELAAFMKSSEDGGRKLIIKPTILGPSSIASCIGLFAMQLSQTAVPFENRLHGFLLWSLVCCLGLFSAVYVWRSYYRQIDKMKSQLQHFRIDQTKAHCCEQGHVDQHGRRIPCDKETISECITHWFGSVEAFERSVRSNVAVALTQSLGNLVFPYKYLLAAGAPSLWGQADFIASRLREEEYYYAAVTACFGLSYWFAAIPFIFACGGLLNYKLRHRYHPILDALMPFLATAFLVLVPGGSLYALQIGLLAVLDDLLAAVLWATITSFLAFFAWRACWREPMLRLD